MIKLSPSLSALVANKVHRFALLWRITRVDGAIFRFTNHNTTINYAGHDYVPASGFSATAREKNDGLKDRNYESVGAITSDAITFEDLRAGKFREAKVEEMVIDWKLPWADPFETQVSYIVSANFTGEVWNVQLEGVTHRLKQTVGRVYSRMCDVKAFGDNRCNVSGGESAFTYTAQTVTGVNVPRKDFQTSVTGYATNNFKHGYLRFTSGLNDNVTMEINKSFGSGRIVLWIPMAFDVAIGDTFNIVVGCDRLLATCRDKFANAANFKGFPFIPGTAATLVTPDYHVKK